MPPIPPPFIEPAAWPDDAIEVAVIVDAWGVKGGIRIKPYSADPKALFFKQTLVGSITGHHARP